MKVLVFSDFHAHNWRQFAQRVSGINSRLRWQINVLDQIKQLIVHRKIDVAIHGGDLFHSVGRLDVDVFNIVHEALQDFPCPLYLVDGNHDLIDRTTPMWFHRSFEKLMDGVRIKPCPSVAEVLKSGGARQFAGVGWSENMDRCLESLEGNRFGLLVLHKEPIGSKYGKFVFEHGVDWNKLEKFSETVLFGHIHEHQKLSPNTWVVGSPMPHNFGDLGVHGVVIVDLDDKSMEFVPLDSPRFLTVDKLDPVAIVDRKNYYRVLGDVKDAKVESNVLSVGSAKEVQERLSGESVSDLVCEYAELKNASREHLSYVRDLLAGIGTDKKVLPQRGWKLKQVQLRNFLSFSEAGFTLNNGVVIVLGRGDSFISNGAGKTALFDAIVWGLFGVVLRDIGVDDVVNRHVGRDCVVELELLNSETGRKVNVRRVRQHRTEGSNASVIVTEASGEVKKIEGLSSVQKLVEEELGCDRALFLNMAYFGQEVLKLLGGLSESERQELVGRLLDVSEFDTLKDKAKQDLAVVETRLSKIQEGKVRFEHQLEFEQKRLIDLGNKKSVVSESRKVEIEGYKVRLGELDSRVVVVQQELVDIESELATARSVGVDPAYLEQVDSLNAERNSLVSEVGIAESRVRELTSKRTRILASKGKSGEICDYCGSTIQESSVDKCASELSGEIAKVSQKLGVWKADLEEVSSDLVSARNAVDSATKDIERVRRGVEQRKDESTRTLRELMYEKGQVESSLKKSLVVEDVEADIENAKSSITAAEAGLDAAVHALEVETAHKEFAEFWIEAFGRKGIPSLLLDRFCNSFNTHVGYYMALLSGGSMKVMLSPQSQLKTGEVRDKLSVQVGVGNPVRWVPYGSLSGGEKRRVDLSMLFALADTYQKRYRMSERLLGVLILDEVFGYLDVDGEESVVSVLQELGRQAAVFVVSHTDELKHHFDDVWTVVKEKGISRLETGEVSRGVPEEEAVGSVKTVS